MFNELKEIFSYSSFTLGKNHYYTVYRNGVYRIVLDGEKPLEVFAGSFTDCERHRNEMKTNYINEKLGRKVKK